jgi:hypothetical protein
MAPRTEQHADNNAGILDFDPIEHFDPTEITPDAPAGGWEFVVPHNEIQKKATRPKEDGGPRYPMLIVPIKLKRADDEENAKFEGAQVDFLIMPRGEDKSKGNNVGKRQLQEFCDQLGVDIGIFPHGDALQSGSFAVFDEFIAEIEGKEGKCWTYIGTDGNGAPQTKVVFREPKKTSGVKTSSRDAEPEAKTGVRGRKTNGTANGAARKPAGRGRS